HTTRATSRTDYSQLCHQLDVPFFRDVVPFLEADNDVILICTSILSLSEVLNSMPLRRLKRQTLFVDVLSVKEHPRNVLLQVLPENMDVLCTHPMFGPESGKNGWKDLPFVYEKVRVRNETRCSSFLHIFESERIYWKRVAEWWKCLVKNMTKLPLEKESATNDSFDLFSGLFIHNRFAQQELMNLEQSFEKVKQRLLKKMSEQQSLSSV
ncbi:hypothetical protein Gotri_016501, partial [Gossypium trilobum]|nr:hypothetical protein [Gossypium trilobum]